MPIPGKEEQARWAGLRLAPYRCNPYFRSLLMVPGTEPPEFIEYPEDSRMLFLPIETVIAAFG